MLTTLLAIAAAPMLAPAAANDQTESGATTASAPAPDVTVHGPERMICRTARRTGTRMRASRVCRTAGQWQEARGGRTQDEELSEAADTLDALGADDLSTNCIGDPLNRTPDTPLGPR